MIKLLQLLTEAKESFEQFASTRLKGAEKIANITQEAGGLSLLTYKHYKVKLPYYKKANIKTDAELEIVAKVLLYVILGVAATSAGFASAEAIGGAIAGKGVSVATYGLAKGSLAGLKGKEIISGIKSLSLSVKV
jgi:hypothetical protein